MKILVTGGAGFIGSAVCRHLIENTGHSVINLDKLTYSSTLTSLASIEASPRYAFVQADVADAEAVAEIFAREKPDAVMHLAAESHVDRSITGPGAFIQTNVVGTYVMLQAALHHWRGLEGDAKDAFRFHHISTDEVYGSLEDDGLFLETTPYDPSSPYSASKAASDHLVMAWHRTYGLPAVISNCSNNYGPYHFPEKLIPLVIINALEGRPLPVYGDGSNVRDWLFVDDHARALVTILTTGRPGQTYNVGGRNERTNLQVVEAICDELDRVAPSEKIGPRRNLITFVADRPGHDHRYAIDATKLETELGWRAQHVFETGLAETVKWYVERRDWWEPIKAAAAERQGLEKKAS